MEMSGRAARQRRQREQRENAASGGKNAAGGKVRRDNSGRREQQLLVEERNQRTETSGRAATRRRQREQRENAASGGKNATGGKSREVPALLGGHLSFVRVGEGFARHCSSPGTVHRLTGHCSSHTPEASAVAPVACVQCWCPTCVPEPRPSHLTPPPSDDLPNATQVMATWVRPFLASLSSVFRRRRIACRPAPPDPPRVALPLSASISLHTNLPDVVSARTDHVLVEVTTIQLTKENYSRWSPAITMGIAGRGRIAYVNGRKVEPAGDSMAWDTWFLEDN
ncbi:hypothetical protein EJ110_NYTH26248 [Nymphaea thermarum]|nr:hypothetical protein EJ110_NYTH26248 [Nymphaea thermarum]